MYDIVVFGANCGKCKKVEILFRKVIANHNFSATVTKNENWEDMATHNVTYVPTVMINGKIVFKGILPTEKQIIEIFNKNN